MLYSAFVRFLKKCAVKMIINKQTNKQKNNFTVTASRSGGDSFRVHCV